MEFIFSSSKFSILILIKCVAPNSTLFNLTEDLSIAIIGEAVYI